MGERDGLPFCWSSTDAFYIGNIAVNQQTVIGAALLIALLWFFHHRATTSDKKYDAWGDKSDDRS